MGERALGEAGHWPTPYPDVNAVVLDFLFGIRTVLGTQLRAMYLSGSLALGDFSPASSDIDVVVVTEAEVSEEVFAGLRALHARFNAGDSPWATEVEAAYIPRDDLRRYDPAHACHPHIQRGPEESLVWDRLASDWVLQRHILRAQGIVVAGPPPDTLIDPVSADEMRRAVAALMRVWWGTMPVEPAPLRRRGYQAYAVLTMCRILYTLDEGTVASKPVAARWAQGALGGRWDGLIARALAWRKDSQQTPDGDVAETVALISLHRRPVPAVGGGGDGTVRCVAACVAQVARTARLGCGALLPAIPKGYRHGGQKGMLIKPWEHDAAEFIPGGSGEVAAHIARGNDLRPYYTDDDVVGLASLEASNWPWPDRGSPAVPISRIPMLGLKKTFA